MAGLSGDQAGAVGVGLRPLASLLFSLVSLSVRAASVEAPVGRIVFWRRAVALAPILAYLAWRRPLRHGLGTGRPLGHVKRSLYGCSAMFFSFLSIAHLPLALATALSFLAPLVVVPMAIARLGERPGWPVDDTTGLGFLGVALVRWPGMINPDVAKGTLIGVGAALVCAAAATVAFADRIPARFRSIAR